MKSSHFSFNLLPILFFLSLSLVNCEFKPQIYEGRKFEVNYDKNTFQKDGKDFRYISGSIHYWRLLEDYWDDVLNKMHLGGLNAITTYVEWSSHQPTPGDTYDFSGNLNIFKFLELAQKNDLLVILRLSPFIDAERDMGGFPPWLLWQKLNFTIRSADLDYTYFVSKWYDQLLPKLVPYLYKNGGPIITLQVENEYGSYSCDKTYPLFLRDLIRMHLGEDVVMFTTDGSSPSLLKCGSLPGVYPTIDFPPESEDGIKNNFNIQRQFAPKGPLVNSEFYTGWIDHWGKPHSKRNDKSVTDALDIMLGLGANVNFYMYYGGTSFGYKAGANGLGYDYEICPTSYDYDAPLSEARDPTSKFHQIKDIISKYIPVPQENPRMSFKAKYGRVQMRPFTHTLNDEFISLVTNKKPITALNPLNFEDLKIGSGFVIYQTIVNFKTPDPTILSMPNLKDRAYIYVDKKFIGVLTRQLNLTSTSIFIKKGQALTILVENQGRICYGNGLREFKGLGQVTLFGKILQNWTMYPLGTLNDKLLNKLAKSFFDQEENFSKFKGIETELNLKTGSGILFTGTFLANNGNHSLLDTFVRLDGWNKGFVWINGFNLGRYWPLVGPQITLYLPGALLKPVPEKNTIIVFELEGSPDSCTNDASDCDILLTDTPNVDGPTPYLQSVIVKDRDRNEL